MKEKKSLGARLGAAGRYLYQEGTVYIILAVLVLMFSILNPLFLSPGNLYNLLTQSTYIIIAGMAICFVMISGGIDMSVGNQMAVCGCTAAIIMLETDLPIWVIWPVCMLIGFLMGCLNGIISAKLKLFPLVVTIATGEVFKGIVYTMTESKSYSGMPEAFRALYKMKIMGLPLDVYLTIAIVVITWLVLNKTHFGRDVLAIGGNKECARLSGIRADLIQTLCFGLTGLIFAIATLDMLAQQNQTSATTGPGTEITCLTAAIIGGISMKGGKGNVFGMVAGIFVMQMIANGMMLAGWGTYTQYTVKGLILIAAIAFDALKNRPKPMVRVRKGGADPMGMKPPMDGKPPFGAPPMDGKPPFGDKPPMGVLPFGGPGGPPPAGFVTPMSDISWVKRKFLDVPYDNKSKRQCFDLYLPDEGDGPFPLLVHIHGGAFAFGDKRDDHMDAYLTGVKRGYAVASIEYRVSSEATFPAAVLDCREAVRYMKDHAEEYKIDPEKVIVIGGSAGGNLAAMLGMNVPNGKFPGEEGRTEYLCEPTVKIAIDQFGPVRFETMTAQAKANGVSEVHPNPDMMPESKYLGVSLSKAPAELLAKSYPGTYASDAMAPMLVQHGTADHLVPWAQSEEFVADLTAKGFGDRVEYMPLEGADHEDTRFFKEENMNLVFKFIEKYL